MPQIAPPPPYPMKGLSQHQKIIAKMCKHDLKKWWLPSDFMQNDEFFVGYEASARLSELQRQYPYMFDSRPAGRFLERRMRFEDGKQWFATCPDDFKKVIRKYYKSTNNA